MIKNAMNPTRNLLVSIMGWSGSGKTTFIESCIERLTNRGYRVCAIKSTHLDISLDTPGTDSFRFQKAGASGVCLLTREGASVFYKDGEERFDRKRISMLFPDGDIILTEGYHGEADLRFEALRGGTSPEDLKVPLTELDGIITDATAPYGHLKREGFDIFSRDDPGNFVLRLIEEKNRQ